MQDIVHFLVNQQMVKAFFIGLGSSNSNASVPQDKTLTKIQLNHLSFKPLCGLVVLAHDFGTGTFEPSMACHA